jgi:ABC-type transport system involved in multi-copper enzyme maturation permease subunit
MIGLPRGAMLVALQEFRIRLRTGRWRWLLIGWVIVLAVFTMLTDLAFTKGSSFDPRNVRGVPLFGTLMLFVLACVLVISPALTSQAINGDRERGTLATLQATKLRPVQIALGKLIAAWGVGLVMLACTLPFILYAMARGGIQLERVAAVYGVVALLIGVVCAISQALSAMLARSITSALLSYVTVFALSVGTLIAFALLGTVVTTQRLIDPGIEGGGSYVVEDSRTDLIWPVLAPNPFVVLIDSAPRVPPRILDTGEEIRIEDYDPLSALSRTIRQVRLPPNSRYIDYNNQIVQGDPVWPWGLGFDLLLGIGCVAITTRRLRAPARRLASGVRIA